MAGVEDMILVILPNYGPPDDAKRCVLSLARNTKKGTYIPMVIDDGTPAWDSTLKDWDRGDNQLLHLHYEQPGGLIRCWNEGLWLAKKMGFGYSVCGHCDTLFTVGWEKLLQYELNHHHQLVGPITNAPGNAPWQNVSRYLPFQKTDEQKYIDRAANKLRCKKTGPVRCKYISGFCMMAKTETWWQYAWDEKSVFAPEGDEIEFQSRMGVRGGRIAFVPRSFVFHYQRSLGD